MDYSLLIFLPSGPSIRAGDSTPDLGEKKAGNSFVFQENVGTLLVSNTSNVFRISKIDLIPAETTMTDVRDNSVRSADTSMEFSPFRWTPPIPPVTNVDIPAKFASFIVDATVVAPHNDDDDDDDDDDAELEEATRIGMSRVVHFLALPSCPALAKSSISSFDNPIRHIPSLIAVVAGVTPWPSAPTNQPTKEGRKKV